MNCGHTICKSCIEQKEKENTLVNCPICFEPQNVPSNEMKINFSIMQILD